MAVWVSANGNKGESGQRAQGCRAQWLSSIVLAWAELPAACIIQLQAPVKFKFPGALDMITGTIT